MDIDDLNLTDEKVNGLPEKTYSIKAEEGLIGSIFLKPKIMSEILEIVNEEDFYKVLERQGKAKVKDTAEDNEIVVSKEAYKTTNISDKYHVKKILVSNRKDNSDRFYVLTHS